jgi:Protein of unknown function (DUF429)
MLLSRIARYNGLYSAKLGTHTVTSSHTVYGIDFTSAPRRGKAITVASGLLSDAGSATATLHIDSIRAIQSFADFEAWLAAPGKWIGAFDFPFGLPRELVVTLGWPEDWRALIAHVQALGKTSFKAALNAVRESRPAGSKYIARRGDLAAGSSSSMKLVNPPVALMFFEGASRLARAGVCVVPNAMAADPRVALEGYPGFLARALTRESYKKDGKEGNTAARVAARRMIVATLPQHVARVYGIALTCATSVYQRCSEDGSGDCLDAVLCAVQAAVAAQYFANGDARYGIPLAADDFEGWIATTAELT